MSVKAQWRRIAAISTLALVAAWLPVHGARAAAPAWYPAWLGGVTLGSWSGDVGLTYANGAQTSSAANGIISSTTTNSYGESMRLANSGFYVISPLLFTGNLSLNLGLNQDKNGGSGTGDESSQQAKVVGYAFDATLLGQTAYPTSVFANRSQSQSLLPSGGRVVGISENRGARFHLSKNSIFEDWGYPWVEANLAIQSENRQNVATSFGRSLTTDEQTRTLNFDASKGFETADLSLVYQFNDRRNAIFSQSNFQSSVANLNYNLDFGPTLNRRFDSTLSLATRNGGWPSTTVSNSELLHIDHYKNLSTDYQYGFNYLSAGGSNSLVQNGAFKLAHQFYQNLSSSVSVNGSQTSLPNGALSYYSVQLGQAYNHSLPGTEHLKGSFSMSWSGGYRSASNNLSSPLVGVVDELHIALAPLFDRVGFLLEQRSVVASSIQVWNVRSGGRIPLNDVASAGLGNGDYEVVLEGRQIRIIPLPTSLRVAANDPLAVSYSYEVAADLKMGNTWSGLGTGVNYDYRYRWVSASFRHLQSVQPVNNATSQFLQKEQQDILQVGLTGVVMNMPVNAGIGWQNSRSNDAASNQSNFNARVSWFGQTDLAVTLDLKAIEASVALPDQRTTSLRSAISTFNWPNMSLIVGVSANKANFTWPAQRGESSIAAQSSLNWFMDSGWTHTAALDWSSHTASALPAETLVQMVGKSSIRLGKLSFNASVGLGQWVRSGSRANNRSFSVDIVRQL